MATRKASQTRVVEVTVTKRITLEKKVCPQCGKEFEGAKVARFCSKTCANKASYRRHAEAIRKDRRERYRSQKEGTKGK